MMKNGLSWPRYWAEMGAVAVLLLVLLALAGELPLPAVVVIWLEA